MVLLRRPAVVAATHPGQTIGRRCRKRSPVTHHSLVSCSASWAMLTNPVSYISLSRLFPQRGTRHFLSSPSIVPTFPSHPPLPLSPSILSNPRAASQAGEDPEHQDKITRTERDQALSEPRDYTASKVCCRICGSIPTPSSWLAIGKNSEMISNRACSSVIPPY